MAYAYRVDGAEVVDGMLRLRVTFGQTPLPASWQGEGVGMSQEQVEQTATLGSEQIQQTMLAALLKRLINDAGGVNATFLASLPGKGILFDVDGVTPGAGQEAIMMGGVVP